MRFLHAHHSFHEKMTFGEGFEHACCIHSHIVGNGTRWTQVFRDKNSSVSMCIKEAFKLCKKSENSIEVVSLVTFSGCEFATWS